MASENETLRWPTNLDRAGIEKRLVQVRESAHAAGLEQLSGLYVGLEAMTPKQLGAAVLAGLAMIQEKPEQRAITMQLEMVAMNLKNLKA